MTETHNSQFRLAKEKKRKEDIGREKFIAAKGLLLGWARAHLGKTHALPLDIYSIAAYKKEKGKR